MKNYLLTPDWIDFVYGVGHNGSHLALRRTKDRWRDPYQVSETGLEWSNASPGFRSRCHQPSAPIIGSRDVRSHGYLAHRLSSRVLHRLVRQLSELGRQRIGQRAELLQQPKQSGHLSALRSDLDLDRDPDPTVRQEGTVHTFRANLRHHSAVRLGDQSGIEAIGAPDQKWVVAHRIDHSARVLFAPSGGDRKARVGPRHPLERHSENHDSTAIHRLLDLPAWKARPEGDLVQNRALHVVIASFVAACRPTLLTRHREHRRVLAGAIVVDTRRALARLAHALRAALRGRIVGPAGEISCLEANVAEHFLGDGDVLRRLRCARLG